MYTLMRCVFPRPPSSSSPLLLFCSVSSLASIVGAPAMVDYAASKSAARSFAEALSLEMKNLKKTGVRVTCVCPSHINTGLFQGFR